MICIPFQCIKRIVHAVCGRHHRNQTLSISIDCRIISGTSSANAVHIGWSGYSGKSHDSSLVKTRTRSSVHDSSNSESKSPEMVTISAFDRGSVNLGPNWNTTFSFLTTHGGSCYCLLSNSQLHIKSLIGMKWPFCNQSRCYISQIIWGRSF